MKDGGRILIEAVYPELDGGRYPVKREIGDTVSVWADILRDLEALERVEVEHQGKRFWLRSEARGSCAAVFRAASVAFPATVQPVSEETHGPHLTKLALRHSC